MVPRYAQWNIALSEIANDGITAFVAGSAGGHGFDPGCGNRARCRPEPDILVFAAASLKNALDEAAAQWQRESGKKVVISYAASNTLIKQIEQGAPADIFISADLDWMDYGQQKGLLKPGQPLQPARKPARADRAEGCERQRQYSARLRPRGATQGRPARDGQCRRGAGGQVWQGRARKARRLGRRQGQDRQAENVRAALVLVARGEAPFGIVYQTDAASDPTVKVVGTFPENTHPSIIYPIALTKESTNPDAQAFLNLLRSPAARPAFERPGFTVLAPGGQRS
jgi:molybdate transport system substrate-binding protein